MELQELSHRTLELFNINNIKDLKKELYEIVMHHDVDKMAKFKELVNGDLSVDWLQKIFQYYLADRENKKQDYTPTSLAKLVAKLSGNCNEVIDMCAGSGALTIQKWNLDKNAKFILYEFDENVIPYLLFNLCLRNIEATVYHKDVLSEEIYNIYKIHKTSEFGEILK